MTNPSIASRQDIQKIELFALPAEYINAFSEQSFSRICCLSLPNPKEDPICAAPSSSIFSKLINSLPNEKIAYYDYNFTVQLRINTVS